MDAGALGRRERVAVLMLGAAVVASAAVGLGVRVPPGAGVGLWLALNGPHLLLALAVGAGFGVAGAVHAARDPAAPGHPLLLAAATGAAFGGMRGSELPALGTVPGFVLGAAAGALVFAGLVRVASRLPGGRRLATGIALMAMLGAAVVAAVGAKGDPTGLRPFVWWLLGDLSRARFVTALPVAVAVAVLVAAVLRRAGQASPAQGSDPGDGSAASAGAAGLLFGLCLGAVGLVAFFAPMVALAARRLAPDAPLRAWAALSGALGALAMVWADALPRALFGGLAPPVGFGIAVLAVPWFLLRNDGRSSPPLRTLEVLLGLVVALMVLVAIFVLSQVARFIA